MFEGRSDKWLINQFNRNRPVEDHVKTIEEMNKSIKEIFGKRDNNDK